MSDPETSDFEQVSENHEAHTPASEDSTPTPPASTTTSTSSSTNEESASITLHSDMSFEDGNIAIIAGNTAFKVHRSVLSRKSALFKDLLSLPQPETEEKFEELPVVRLLDPPEDISTLLDAIYNGARYRFRDDEAPSWTTVHKLLVLGTKYQVDELRDEAIHQLNARYPRKIGDWDYTCRTDSDTSSTVVVSYPIEEDLVIANVARAMDLPDIHLAALYGCCSLPFDVLVRGRTLEDGTVEQLCQDDLFRCLQGKENLLVVARSELRMNLFELDTITETCRQPNVCAEKIARLRAKYRTTEERPRRLYDPLRPDDEEIERHCTDEGLCHECIKYYILRHGGLRQEIRTNLSKYICADRAFS